MEQRIDLNGLLSQLYSDEGRARVIYKLVGKMNISEEHINRAIDVYEKAGMFASAAEVAQKAGLTYRAIEFYEKAGRFDDAAEVAQKAGLTDRAQVYYNLEKLLQ